jgi:hypothetical protein
MAGCHKERRAEMEKIKTSKREAFLLEFPWLQKYISNAVASIKVQRIDSDLCRRNLKKTDIALNLFSDDVLWEEIFLLDAEGKELAKVGQIPQPAKPKTFWKRNPKPFFRYNGKETVEEALFRLEVRANEVRFVLSVDWIKHNWPLKVVTIFKPPKKFSLPEWLKEEIKIARNEIGKELAAINIV